MQDRTSANSMKVLLQRAAGPYIGVNLDRGGRSHNMVHVRFAPQSGHGLQVSLRLLLTQMYGPAVRCKRTFIELADVRSCINVSGL